LRSTNGEAVDGAGVAGGLELWRSVRRLAGARWGHRGCAYLVAIRANGSGARSGRLGPTPWIPRPPWLSLDHLTHYALPRPHPSPGSSRARSDASFSRVTPKCRSSSPPFHPSHAHTFHALVQAAPLPPSQSHARFSTFPLPPMHFPATGDYPPISGHSPAAGSPLPTGCDCRNYPFGEPQCWGWAFLL